MLCSCQKEDPYKFVRECIERQPFTCVEEEGEYYIRSVIGEDDFCLVHGANDYSFFIEPIIGYKTNGPRLDLSDTSSFEVLAETVRMGIGELGVAEEMEFFIDAYGYSFDSTKHLLRDLLDAFVDNQPLELSNLQKSGRFDLGVEIYCVKDAIGNGISYESVVYHAASANQTDGYLIIKDMQLIRQNSSVIEYEIEFEFDAPIHSNRELQIPSFSSRIKGTFRTFFSAPN